MDESPMRNKKNGLGIILLIFALLILMLIISLPSYIRNNKFEKELVQIDTKTEYLVSNLEQDVFYETKDNSVIYEIITESLQEGLYGYAGEVYVYYYISFRDKPSVSFEIAIDKRRNYIYLMWYYNNKVIKSASYHDEQGKIIEYFLNLKSLN